MNAKSLPLILVMSLFAATASAAEATFAGRITSYGLREINGKIYCITSITIQYVNNESTVTRTFGPVYRSGYGVGLWAQEGFCAQIAVFRDRDVYNPNTNVWVQRDPPILNFVAQNVSLPGYPVGNYKLVGVTGR